MGEAKRRREAAGVKTGGTTIDDFIFNETVHRIVRHCLDEDPAWPDFHGQRIVLFRDGDVLVEENNGAFTRYVADDTTLANFADMENDDLREVYNALMKAKMWFHGPIPERPKQGNIELATYILQRHDVSGRCSDTKCAFHSLRTRKPMGTA